MNDIVIVDLGTGNLRSVFNAVKHVAPNKKVVFSHHPQQIIEAPHLILPGQGAIRTWMDRLKPGSELREAVDARLERGPLLGICLGLQALFNRSEENLGVACLGKLEGLVRHFTAVHSSDNSSNLKVPHMGWNKVRQTSLHPLWSGITDNERFYFVHSYFVDAEDPEDVTGTTEYGETFCAAAARDNCFAVQFHPEKSQSMGLKLLENFVNWNGVR